MHHGWQSIHCLLSSSEMLWAVQVRHVDPDMEFYGRGPLLSCKYMDASTLWHRAEQIAQVLEEVRPCPFTLFMHPWRDSGPPAQGGAHASQQSLLAREKSHA